MRNPLSHGCHEGWWGSAQLGETWPKEGVWSGVRDWPGWKEDLGMEA